MSISKSHKVKSKREVIVVLKSGIGPLDTAQPAVSAGAPDARQLAAMLSEYGARMRPVTSQAPAPLMGSSDATSREARRNVERYHSVSAPEDQIDALTRSLEASPAVESIYIKPPAEPPAVKMRQAASPPAGDEVTARETTPDFTARQDYLGPAPVGVDAKYAWSLPGGRGTGVRIIDCEWAWNFDHEDLATHCSGNVVGTAQTSDDDHGTSVSGVLIANDNSLGITGIAPDAILATAAFDESSYQPTSAIIMQAADHLASGDILLLEIHRPGPHAPDPPDGQAGYIAIEWWPDDFAAIAYATSKGILVVEAAGNGSENLNDPLYDVPDPGFPADWKNPFAAGGPDSGAILVGAGNPPAGTHGREQDTYGFNEPYVDRARCSFSNYGSRVDCQGWGWEVSTLGGGDLYPGTTNVQTNNHSFLYTDVFAGTSSASPIVAGTLACLHGMHRATGRPLLTPNAAKSLLRSTGSTQQPAPGRPVTQRIGTRPDLKALWSASPHTLSSPALTDVRTIPGARQHLNIVADFIPVGNSNRPGSPLVPRQITIHNTDNSDLGADARAHAIYQKGKDAQARQVSWHFTVDDHNVYQSLPVSEVGWHTGTHRGNHSTIGIEICQNQGIDQNAANDRAALLTAVQLHELGISMQGNVVQHFNWSGKDCPMLLRNPSSNWQEFLAKVAYYYEQVQLNSPEAYHGALIHPSPYSSLSTRRFNTAPDLPSASKPNIPPMTSSALKILLVHGIDVNEETNPYASWETAVTDGLHGASYSGSVDGVGLNYNDLFAKNSSNILLYAAAVAELLASAAWHTITPAAPAPDRPIGDFLSQIRWSAGMVAQWVVENELRSELRDRIFDQIENVKPDVILAHSLGSLICYDFFRNDPRGETAFLHGTLITFGSQIGNTFVKDRMWNGEVEMIPVARWINLYNQNDPVFVAPIDVLATSFYQFLPVFGTPTFDSSAHEPTQGNGHPGYLDNSITDKYVWPLLAGGGMAALIRQNMRIMKRTPKALKGTAKLPEGTTTQTVAKGVSIPTTAVSPDRHVAVLEPPMAADLLFQSPAIPPEGIDQIIRIAAGSDILRYPWENRGVAPAGYIKGMAVVFAKVYCKLKSGDSATIEMAKATSNNGSRDALAWYSERFQASGMNNDLAGSDTLRHLFVLMVGLGMRESSGRYCEGRDRSEHNITADTAEAGLFQTSFNARFGSPLMPMLFAKYSANPAGFVEVFQEGVHVKPSDLENFGTGDGVEFQRLSKASPAFAVEFAAVGLRNIRAHWGPVNTRSAELRNECDLMFRQVQAAVDGHNLCPAFA